MSVKVEFPKRFTRPTEWVLRAWCESSAAPSVEYMDTPRLLLAMAESPGSVSRLLHEHGVTPDEVRRRFTLPPVTPVNPLAAASTADLLAEIARRCGQPGAPA